MLCAGLVGSAAARDLSPLLAAITPQTELEPTDMKNLYMPVEKLLTKVE